jgi:hypothetical protein
LARPAALTRRAPRPSGRRSCSTGRSACPAAAAPAPSR